MGTLTARGGFIKSDASEPADVAVYSTNMDKMHDEVMSVPYTTVDPAAVDTYPGKIILRDAGDPTFFLPDFKIARANSFWFVGNRGTWVSYTPTLAFGDIGNGTLRGRYCYQGNILWCEVFIVRGSTTVFEASGLGVSTPSGVNVRIPNNDSLAYIGHWMARVGGNLYKGRANRRITSVGVDIQLRKPTTSGSEVISNTLPVAWGTGDKLYVQVMCEVDR